MTPGPVVVETADQRELLDSVLAATTSGRPCAILDPAWPAGVRSAARESLSAATRSGRVRDGDLVLFTSGSTHHPRGVVRTVASWEASAEALTSITGTAPGDVVWLPGRLTSSLFLYGAWHAASSGLPVVLRGEEPEPATVVHCVPGQLPALLDDVQRGRLRRLRLVVTAGDRLPPGLRARTAAAGLRLVEYYGAAELSFVAWRDDDGPLRTFPGVRADVRDGVVWAASPYLARGYLTGAGALRTDGGWATVGDLAESVPGGLQVSGRGGSAVTTGGHTVVVEDVELALRAVPGVRDAGVVGLPHHRLGSLLVAVVVGESDDATLRDAIRALPAPARPRRLLRATRLPRTDSGKLRRPELAALATTLAAR